MSPHLDIYFFLKKKLPQISNYLQSEAHMGFFSELPQGKPDFLFMPTIRAVNLMVGIVQPTGMVTSDP